MTWKPRGSSFRRSTIILAGAFAAAGCAASASPAAPAAPPVRAKAEDQTPTSFADMQGATTLDLERYRPRQPVEGCPGASLPSRAPSAPLSAAIAEAQAYSDAKGGFALLVLHDGALVHEAYAQGVTSTRQIVTASMAKSVLGLMIGIAQERGIIGSLADPLSAYFPEWADDPRGAITIEQALQMSSGIAPSNFQKVLLGPDIGAAALETPLAVPPGSAFSYNNAVSQLLVMALERRLEARGAGSYRTFLHDALWCPLGNDDASLWVDPLGKPRGYAGLNAGAHDWARLGELIRNRGRAGAAQVVPTSWIAAMVTPAPTNAQYGYHVWLGREWTAQRRYSVENPVTVPHGEAFAAEDIVYFDGFGGQRVYVIASRGLTIVRLGHVDLQFDDAVIPNLLVRAVDETARSR